MCEGYCDVCGRRNSWGCGHTGAQRYAARRHNNSKAHREGRCWHFDHSRCGDSCQKARDEQPTSGWVPMVHHEDVTTGKYVVK